MFWVVLSESVAGRSSAQALEDERGDDTAGEGGTDEDLGMLLDRQVGQRARQGPPPAAVPAGCSKLASPAPTTGVGCGPAVVGLWRSSVTPADLPRRRGAKSSLRARVVATDASAPIAGEQPRPHEALDDVVLHRPDPISRSRRGSVEAAADRLHDERLGLLELRVAARQHLEDPAGQHLLDRAVEGQRREPRRDRVLELAVGLGPRDDPRDQLVGLADLLPGGSARTSSPPA